MGDKRLFRFRCSRIGLNLCLKGVEGLSQIVPEHSDTAILWAFEIRYTTLQSQKSSDSLWVRMYGEGLEIRVIDVHGLRLQLIRRGFLSAEKDMLD